MKGWCNGNWALMRSEAGLSASMSARVQTMAVNEVQSVYAENGISTTERYKICTSIL